jgi:hypothetical protein
MLLAMKDGNIERTSVFFGRDLIKGFVRMCNALLIFGIFVCIFR